MSNVIHQTIHGYSNGHKLLFSSVELSTQTKSTLLRESDSPGEEFHHQKKPCYSGYSIVESGFYIISKTWVAKEINRPGCVWTHSLLIPFTLLAKHNVFNNIDMEDIFLSKIEIEGYQSLSPIDLILVPHMANNKDLSWMFSQVFTSNNQVILNSENYSLNDIISIWDKLWPKLRREFSFKTWAPKKIRSSSNFEKYNLIISNYAPLEIISDNWAQEYFSPNSLIHSFNWKYGASLGGGKGGVFKLYKAWLLYNNNKIDELIDYLLRWNKSPIPLVKKIIRNTSKNNLTLPLAYLISKYILTLKENDVDLDIIIMTGNLISKSNSDFFKKVVESEFFYKKAFYSEGIKNINGDEVAELVNNQFIQLDSIENKDVLSDDNFWNSLSTHKNLNLINGYKSYNDIPFKVLKNIFNNFDLLELDENLVIYITMANFNIDRKSHREKIIKCKGKVLTFINEGFKHYSTPFNDFIFDIYLENDLSTLSDNSLCNLYLGSSWRYENIILLINVLCMDHATSREKCLDIILDNTLKKIDGYELKYLEMSKIRSLLNNYLNINTHIPISLAELLVSFEKNYTFRHKIEPSKRLLEYINSKKKKEGTNKDNQKKHNFFWFLDL